jgi:hypothetical protein
MAGLPSPTSVDGPSWALVNGAGGDAVAERLGEDGGGRACRLAGTRERLARRDGA